MKTYFSKMLTIVLLTCGSLLSQTAFASTLTGYVGYLYVTSNNNTIVTVYTAAGSPTSMTGGMSALVFNSLSEAMSTGELVTVSYGTGGVTGVTRSW